MLVRWVPILSSLCCLISSLGFCLSFTLVDLSIWEFAPFGYVWIWLDMSGYRWIWKDMKRYLLDIFWQNRISFRGIQEKISTGDIQEISRHIQRYPSHISMRDILWYISKTYPRISMLIQMEYPLQISITYPQKISRIYPMISKDIQMNIHADIRQISYVISN